MSFPQQKTLMTLEPKNKSLEMCGFQALMLCLVYFIVFLY